MWKKGAVAAFAAALLVAGVVLLHGISSPRADATPPVVAKGVQTQPTRLVTVDLDPRTRFGSGVDRPTDVPTPATRGPSAGVWAVMGKAHATVAEEREALAAALKAAPACLEKWCGEARSTLSGWQAAISAKVPGALTATPVECSSAGCWTTVAVADPLKWRDVHAALPTVTMQMGWPGPSILGGPDFQTQRGSVISIWAVLPVVNAEISSTERGVE